MSINLYNFVSQNSCCCRYILVNVGQIAAKVGVVDRRRKKYLEFYSNEVIAINNK
jgi:hypothetical protein